MIYLLDAPKATALVIRPGTVVFTGAKHEADVHEALANLFDGFGGLGIEVPDSPAVTVQNIVSTTDLGNSLNLDAVAIGLGLEYIEYEPEQFPGARLPPRRTPLGAASVRQRGTRHHGG